VPSFHNSKSFQLKPGLQQLSSRLCGWVLRVDSLPPTAMLLHHSLVVLIPERCNIHLMIQLLYHHLKALSQRSVKNIQPTFISFLCVTLVMCCFNLLRLSGAADLMG
jgi:hypothetical protein